MIRCQCDMPAPVDREGADRLVVHDVAGHDGHERVVTIVFTDRQIAYLNDRMAAVGHPRPLGRVGGARFSVAFLEGSPFR